MKILAMDLSLSCPAFCVAEARDRVLLVHHLSHIKTNAKKSRGYRLFQIYNHMKEILEEHPDITEVVREKGFSKFPSVTQTLFQVVGISTICAFKHGGHEVIHEIPPTTVKKLVTGSGKSTKDKVADMAKELYGLEIQFKTDDESDAVGVAIAFFLQKKALV